MRTLTQVLRRGADRGSYSLEAAIIAVPLLLLFGLIVIAGRVGGAHTNIDAAAANAARAASISRTVDQAHSAAAEAARTTLAGQGMSCPSPDLTIDTSGFGAPTGQVGVVRVSVSCTVQLGDLGLPTPGTRTLTGSATSVVDAYRQRSAP